MQPRLTLAGSRESPVLLFDEDMAKGTMLNKVSEVLRPDFEESCTASVLRHDGVAWEASPRSISRDLRLAPRREWNQIVLNHDSTDAMPVSRGLK